MTLLVLILPSQNLAGLQECSHFAPQKSQRGMTLLVLIYVALPCPRFPFYLLLRKGSRGSCSTEITREVPHLLGSSACEVPLLTIDLLRWTANSAGIFSAGMFLGPRALGDLDVEIRLVVLNACGTWFSLPAGEGLFQKSKRRI
ncbi:hypothetical protein SAY86_019787 [Trapa natans]|uniref:Uncharacterized protein n=1 Tax=Trapa natans TaxID=22666 RepID=A0AAN7LY49_TRANT|nr:hypothetical protein SAY86_019787 [Trapa natans]